LALLFSVPLSANRQGFAPPQFDNAIFQKPIPSDELSFLTSFAGRPTKDILRDKQFRKLMHTTVPECMFHYGRDMSQCLAILLPS
jgi:hypothetical protein